MTPLAGIKVVDFGHVWAGPYCSATLADLGADVVKIESPKRLDVHRRQGPYPDNEAGINRSGVWNAQNRNKKSICLDLTDPAQRDEAKQLVRQSDIVIENFSPGVMKKLGLDYEALRAIKPDIIMASLSAFGQTGPQSRYVGYGPSLDAWSGLCSLNAYPDGRPQALGGMFPDTASALYACFAVLNALRRRDESGEGCYIDLSELEVSALLLVDQLLGNSDAYAVPQNTYPCNGDDAWIMISIDSERAWSALCGALDKREWADDPAMRTQDGRRRNLATIEREIVGWTRARSAHEAFEILQAHEVPAGVALTIAELLDDAQLRSREFFREVVHPEVGLQTIYAPIWRFDGVAGETRPAPLLGADTEALLTALGEVR